MPGDTLNPGFVGDADEREDLLEEGQDISKPQRERLGQYLSRVTRGKEGSSPHANAYTVKPNATEIGPGIQSGETEFSGENFVEILPSDVKAHFNQLSNSGKFDEGPEKLADIIDKNSREKQTLITDITPESDTIVQRKVSQILLKNRFSPRENKFVDFATSEKPLKHGGSVQTTMGVYNKNATAIDIDDLRKVGLSLLLRATGYDKTDKGKDPDHINETSVALPSPVQLSISKVDTQSLRAKNAFGAERIVSQKDEFSSLNEGGEFFEENDDSFGVLNSHLEPFGKVGSISMNLVAATGMVSLAAASAAVYGLVAGSRTAGKPWGQPRPRSEDPILMKKGVWGPNNVGTTVLDLFGIPKTEYPLDACIFRGISAFFGFEFLFNLTSLNASDIVESSLNLFESPGYYAVVMRSLVRDVNQIKNSVKDFKTNSVGGFESVLGVIDSLVSSTTFKFIRVMTQIGDKVLQSENLDFHPAGQELDELPETAENRVRKSRIGTGAAQDAGKANRLVWRHSALPSRYYLPTSLNIAASQVSARSAKGATGISSVILDKCAIDGKKATSDTALLNNQESRKRLSPEYVEFIENKLEAEYVPFYFHDLRTNEFLAFHAFIEGLTDGYTANYNNVKGYGRIDPVRTYESTDRAISFSFSLVATSQEDFDVLWWDINKLTTLVYPQWSRGKQQRTSGADPKSFIQPFSQIPTASPMIRVRIGDFIKGNYSKFGLARLFGAGIAEKKNGVFNINKSPMKTDSKAQIKAKLEELSRLEKRVRQTPLVLNDKNGFQVGMKAILSPSSIGKVAGSFTTASPEKNILRTGDVDARVKITKQTTVQIVRRVQFSESVSKKGSLSKDGVTVHYIVKLVNPDPKDKVPSNTEFHVEHSSLQPDKNHLRGYIAQTKKPTKRGDNNTMNNDFFSDKNAIVRSFKSTAGRGLAGFITSLNYDTSMATWETRRAGSKAPMMLKVSISFAPIHDIAPGIDSDGFNRAPVYNVGKIVNDIAGDPHDTDFDRDINK